MTSRRLVTDKDDIVGDTILKEEPFVACQFAWNRKCGFVACSYCLRSLEPAEAMASRLAGQEVKLPHPELCPNTSREIVTCEHCDEVYCDPSCRDKAWKLHHRLLCKQNEQRATLLAALDEAWRDVHKPPETTSAMLLVRLLAQLVTGDERTREAMGLLCHHTKVEIGGTTHVHKLLSPEHVGAVDSMKPFILDLVSSWADDADVTLAMEWATDRYYDLWALVGLNSLGVGSSAISQFDIALTHADIAEEEKQETNDFMETLYEIMFEHSGEFLDAEGTGLFLQQSACNHSCTPNAECQFKVGDHTVQVVATTKISKGEEVFISYLDDHLLCASRNDRWEELRRGYLFECGCHKCGAQAMSPDEPDPISDFEDDEEEEEEEDDDDDDEGEGEGEEEEKKQEDGKAGDTEHVSGNDEQQQQQQVDAPEEVQEDEGGSIDADAVQAVGDGKEAKEEADSNAPATEDAHEVTDLEVVEGFDDPSLQNDEDDGKAEGNATDAAPADLVVEDGNDDGLEAEECEDEELLQ